MCSLPSLAIPQVGVRLNRLLPGARLRRHRGPGNRLVAHLGIIVPTHGAELEVDGLALHWTEGQFVVFDDS